MPNSLRDIKDILDQKRGKKIKLVAQIGRKKTKERKGILADTYPAVFVVELNEDDSAYERVSYSYTDILTNTVELEFGE